MRDFVRLSQIVCDSGRKLRVARNLTQYAPQQHSEFEVHTCRSALKSDLRATVLVGEAGSGKPSSNLDPENGGGKGRIACGVIPKS
jgi:hypothetical protein